MKLFFKKNYPLILLFLSAVILIVRAFYGFCWSDESFYYSTAYRFLQGDIPFYEEWHPTQLNGIFLLPFVALYRLITGSNTGILLTFRILYVLVSVFIAYMVFTVLSKETKRAVALISALLFLYYTHLNIATFSYYALSVLAGVLSALYILHYLHMQELQKKADRFLVYSGIAYAVLVLSMPLMAVFYFLAVILALLAHFGKRVSVIRLEYREKITILRLPHMLLYHLYGILIVAVPFFIYLFSTLSLTKLVQSLTYVLTDEEHDETTMYVALRNCFLNLTDTFGKIIYLCFLLLIVSILLYCFRLFCGQAKNKTGNKFFCFANSFLFCADIVAFIGLLTKCIGHTGYVQIALVLFALPLFFMQDSGNWRVFVLFVPLGACISYCYICTSGGFSVYAEAIGFAVAGIAAPALIIRYAEDVLLNFGTVKTQNAKILLYVPLYAVLLSVLLLTASLRMINIYRDDAVSRLTCRIPNGPAAGLLTTAAHLQDYESVLSVLQSDCTMAAYPEGTHRLVLFSKLLPWGYLATDMHCASFSSWRSSMNSEELRHYYDLHPDKCPDVILLLNESVGSYETCGDVEADPVPNANDADGHLYQYLKDRHFTEKNVPCGTLYVKP